MNRRKRVYALGVIILFVGVFSTSAIFNSTISSTENGWEIYAGIVFCLLIARYGFHVIHKSLKNDQEN